MSQLFSVHTVLFTAWGYEMSYLELAATLLNLWSVWLTTRRRILSWPIGIVAVVLTGLLFFQIQLYSDLVEQIYYFFSGFVGWIVWSRARKDSSAVPVEYNSWVVNGFFGIAMLCGTLGLGAFMSNIHLYFASIEAASLPYLDAFTTVMSFAAQVLMIRRRIESWYLWILVDVIGVGLYFYKGVVLIAVMYAIFLVLATLGLLSWQRQYRRRSAWASA